ncbi:hypothetical protein [Shewanella halifaxensis]|nr:hypothetical protein [Shewanella halifaxensis]
MSDLSIAVIDFTQIGADNCVAVAIITACRPVSFIDVIGCCSKHNLT